MSPTAKAVAYGIVSLAAFAITFWCAYAALDRPQAGCLPQEESYYGSHARTQPRRQPERRHRLPYAVRHPWRYLILLRWARQERSWARDAAAFAHPDGTAPANPSAGAVPLDIRATSSDGFPAIAFRAGEYLP